MSPDRRSSATDIADGVPEKVRAAPRRILAIETSSTACSVALQDEQGIRVDHRIAPRAHAQLLLPMIDALLAAASMRADTLDALAWGAGPGSFTGLRISAAVIQAMAWTNDLPVIGCSSLEVLARSGLAAARLAGTDPADVGSASDTPVSRVDGVLVLVDARMGELYWNAFRRDGDDLLALGPDALQRPEAMLEALAALPTGRWLLAGDGLPACVDDVLARLDVMAALPDQVPDARWLLPIAQRRLRAGQFGPAQSAVPVYLRDERAWRRLDDPPRPDSATR